jgi:hypothetical protein
MEPTMWEQDVEYYRCRRCKFPLAPKSAAVSFTSFHDRYACDSDSGCTHIFLSNPLPWMKQFLVGEESFGDIYCPGCEDHADGGNRVGEFCYLGLQCQGKSCGEICAPGLALFENAKDRLPDGGVELHFGRLSLEEVDERTVRNKVVIHRQLGVVARTKY